jgi:NAD(P)H dehydrogenase (quinone)
MTLYGITGSTGHVGGRVARTVAGEEPLRLIVRDRSRAPQLPGAEIAVATYGDRPAAVAALRGVDVLFMVSAAESRTRREEHRSFIAAAAEAGVGHIVYTSFVGAAPDAVFTLGRDHGDAEVAIRASGMRYTLLRDNFYSDLLPFFADDAGVIRGPAGNGRVAAVARADVVDVAVAVLRRPEVHRDVVHQLTGPEALTMAEIAERGGAFLDRSLRYHDETVDEAYESRAVFGAEQWQLDAWVSTYLAIALGEVADVSPDVERLTGHPARTIEEALAADR